jgi:hypothetical protein
VVFVHGSGSSMHSPRNRYVAAVLNDAGLGTLLFDLLVPIVWWRSLADGMQGCWDERDGEGLRIARIAIARCAGYPLPRACSPALPVISVVSVA